MFHIPLIIFIFDINLQVSLRSTTRLLNADLKMPEIAANQTISHKRLNFEKGEFYVFLIYTENGKTHGNKTRSPSQSYEETGKMIKIHK